jgi:ATP-dependent DNA ligase
VLKRLGSRYHSGRSRDWPKFKVQETIPFWFGQTTVSQQKSSGAAGAHHSLKANIQDEKNHPRQHRECNDLNSVAGE